MATTERKNFVVLGMHRSATSLVSKAIADQGFTCRNEEDVQDSTNPQGYWEDAEVGRLNDRILERAGGDWLRPPSSRAIAEQVAWAAPRVTDLMGERYPEDGWVIKDPRLVLTCPCWLPHFRRRHAQFVFIYRERAEVIESLIRRGDEGERTITRCVDEHLNRLCLLAVEVFAGAA